MARAFVEYSMRDIRPAPAADTFFLPIHITYAGNDLPRIDKKEGEVELLFTDTPAAMQGKIVDKVVADAGLLGYSVARSGVLMPPVVKGS